MTQLEKQLQASVSYLEERRRQLEPDTGYTAPTVSDEQLELVHEELRKVMTK